MTFRPDLSMTRRTRWSWTERWPPHDGQVHSDSSKLATKNMRVPIEDHAVLLAEAAAQNFSRFLGAAAFFMPPSKCFLYISSISLRNKCYEQIFLF